MSRRFRYVALGLLFGMLLPACGDDPFVHDDLEGKVLYERGWVPTSLSPRLALLLVVENTPELEARSERIIEGVDTFLRMTLGGLCIQRETGDAVDPPTRPDEDGYCDDSDRFAAVAAPRVRVGVITTSLGGPGCGPLLHGDDRALLLPRVREGLDADHPAGFVEWLPGGDVEVFLGKVRQHLLAVGSEGCPFPAPWEAAHRFFNGGEVEPPATHVGSEGDLSLQRSQFLEKGFPYLVLTIGAEDCSLPRELDVTYWDPSLFDRPAGWPPCGRLLALAPDDPRYPADRYLYGPLAQPIRHPERGEPCRYGWCESAPLTHRWALWENELWERSPRSEALVNLGDFVYLTQEVRSGPGIASAHPQHFLAPTPGTLGCFDRELRKDEEGQVPCRMVEVRSKRWGPLEGCNEPGLRPLDPDFETLVLRGLRQQRICDGPHIAPCVDMSLCEVEQLVGAAADECRTNPRTRQRGFCHDQATATDEACVPGQGTLRVVAPPARPLPPGGGLLAYWCAAEQ